MAHLVCSTHMVIPDHQTIDYGILILAVFIFCSFPNKPQQAICLLVLPQITLNAHHGDQRFKFYLCTQEDAIVHPSVNHILLNSHWNSIAIFCSFPQWKRGQDSKPLLETSIFLWFKIESTSTVTNCLKSHSYQCIHARFNQSILKLEYVSYLERKKSSLRASFSRFPYTPTPLAWYHLPHCII